MDSRGWPIKQRSLCLIGFRFGQTTAISFFREWDSLVIFPLAIRIPVKASRVCPDVTNQVIDIQIVLLFNLSFDFLPQFLKPGFQTAIANFLCFRMSFVSFTNQPPYPRCDPRNWACRSTNFWRNVFVCSFLNKRSYQIEIFLDRTIVRVTVEAFFISKIQSVLPHRVVITFLI